jgi:hypothetical protein
MSSQHIFDIVGILCNSIVSKLFAFLSGKVFMVVSIKLIVNVAGGSE